MTYFAPHSLGATVGASVQEGITLVSCCMNRNENLLKALPSWLALRSESGAEAGLCEIIIVDWSSQEPVALSLAKAQLTDPRIRVIRVEEEPNWVLSWAFNLGFRMVRSRIVLKADADITLAPDFLRRNPLPPNSFIAGNWRHASAQQAYVNGCFMTERAALIAVNGFNECITSYGWDDDDLYQRFEAAGLQRHDLALESLHHLDHDDDHRLGLQLNTPQNSEEELAQTPLFSIRANRQLAGMLPPWGPQFHGQDWQHLTPQDPSLPPLLRRRSPPPHPVAAALRNSALRNAARELLSWHCGTRLSSLGDQEFMWLLKSLRQAEILPLHVELLLAGAGAISLAYSRFLLLDGRKGAPAPEQIALCAQHGQATGRMVVYLPPLTAGLTSSQPSGAKEVFTLPHPRELGAMSSIAHAHQIAGHSAAVLALKLPPAPTLAAPPHCMHRDLVVIEPQHGLGNRLRAIASAATIAEASERELAILWRPDPHCEAEFTDLFTGYEGAVSPEETLIAHARNDCDFYNYMEIEEGAYKDAPITLRSGTPLWLRSAYRLNHPASQWANENQWLRRLRPNALISEQLASQPKQFDLSIHIRMEGGSASKERQVYDEAHNWPQEAHHNLLYWRNQSHYSRFIHRIDNWLQEQPHGQMFLAADQSALYSLFRDRYGERLNQLPRNTDNRSVSATQTALADILLLGRASHFLGSSWSSFSELAIRLSPQMKRIEMSGRAF